jgi:hypothetical protein
MNEAQVEALRALLEPTGWLESIGRFAKSLRRRATSSNGLLIVGTPASEPWHLTAHLADEARLAELPELTPTLVRWAPPAGAPPHLSVGIDRLGRTCPDLASPGLANTVQTLLVVSPGPAPEELLERIADARRAGTAIFALDRGDDELDEIAHESLSVRPRQAPVTFDGAQHLVSLAVGDRRSRPASAAPRQSRRPGPRAHLTRLLDIITGPGDEPSP